MAKSKKKPSKFEWEAGDVIFMEPVPGSPAAKAGNPLAKTAGSMKKKPSATKKATPKKS